MKKQPTHIGNFQVTEGIGRGFYSAVYRAIQPSLDRTVVLKVVPISIYDYFQKDWKFECREHAAIADGTPFIANITEQFDEEIDFGGSKLFCHIAVLINIPGPTLEEALKNPEKHGIGPRTAAQVAADIFEILNLFSQYQRFHNDLHAGNIILQKMTAQTLRSGVIDPEIRAVAIDLSSILDASRSGCERLGDRQLAARHISALAHAIHQKGKAMTDLDYRVASALRGLAEHLSPSLDAQRMMTIDDALLALRTAVAVADEPWRQRLSLHSFGDAYNAQALESWHVPELWFDPDNKWLSKTTVRGPQVVTGMRGCGKTMLLRALHFHARAVQASINGRNRNPLIEIEKDDFVGVYASCQKLLNTQEFGTDREGEVNLPFERLFVAYLRDVVQVLRHIRSLDNSALLNGIDVLLFEALRPLDMKNIAIPDSGERAFEHFLIDLQFQLSYGQDICRLKMAPAEAFGHLAAIVRKSSPILNNKYVLFLLDDVSTRYLRKETVRELISQLIFQHPHCAFRITTETQALHRVLLSPGGSAPADPNRDYEEFNLGNEVYRLLKEGSIGDSMEFVSEIIRRRGQQFKDELYRLEPKKILGDIPLEDIAREIAETTPSSPARKRVYRGMRALQAVCVGDLGDVIKLYEKIIRHAKIGQLPVSPEKQTDCYLEQSASLVHFLNRRDQKKKTLALSFAQAAGELLHLSAKNLNATLRGRIRQYTKLYVRVGPDPDLENVTAHLMDLLDAGVFVYDGGGPRTKIRDNDPVLHFKLSYRKMLGLSSYIGLSDRDRFEPPDKTLRLWLKEPDPKKAAKILVDSEAKRATMYNSDEQNDLSQVPAPKRQKVTITKKSPLSLPPQAHQLEFRFSPVHDREVFCPPSLGITVNHRSITSMKDKGADAVILAMGFEERARVSAERLLDAVRPQKAILVRYSDDQGSEIASLIKRFGIKSEIITSPEELQMATHGQERVIVDSSGLSKPFLFIAVRDVLKKIRNIGIAHTLAKHYYPRNSDLLALGVEPGKPVPSEVFARLGEVLMGESGPYQLKLVHHEDASPERWRSLIASSSPKNDRLLHLLDARGYDTTRILVPPPTTPRRSVALTAVELAASAAESNVGLIEVDTNDIEKAIQSTEEVYKDLYYKSGANVEVGLTGPKVHTIAFAALAAAARVSFAWYVSPKYFDRTRFTVGVANTDCFEISLRPEVE
ncbi:MAG: hypothetical protein C4548_02680 [Desulfobacteraceae bacterium]|nr:MAG: hypothetical protein C4548_02680 [Desulfobacteraceae bacterium]